VFKKTDIKKREKEVQRISQKLNNQNMRSLSITSGNKRVEYFPAENIIIKGSRSIMNPLHIVDEDTKIFSDDENPKEKKISNKIINYILGKGKLTGEKLKVKRSKIKHNNTRRFKKE
jgi:hypothetical protein